MLLFNDLLAKDLLTEQNINSGDVLVLRHTPSDQHRALRDFLPTLADERPELFNAYQSTQGKVVEGKMLKATYVASFIGLEKQRAAFIGLYKVGDHRTLTREAFRRVPAHQELEQYGFNNDFGAADKRPSVLWFDLALEAFYQKWKGKLIIDWPSPAIHWARFANEVDFPVYAISQDSLLNRATPAWDELIVSSVQLVDCHAVGEKS